MDEDQAELEEMKNRVREEYDAKKHEPLTAENLREMKRFCDNLVNDLAHAYLDLQEKFKQGVLGIAQLGDAFENDAKAKEREEKTRDTTVTNVFNNSTTEG